MKICTFKNFELETRKKCSGGITLSCAFINICGAPHKLKNQHKSIKFENIINRNDITTVIETGTTDKDLDLTRTDVNLI